MLIGLLVSGRSVISSAFISIASVIVVSCFSAETRFTPKSLYHTLELSSRNALMISTCSACAGIIVAIVSITGIGYKFISIITDLGQFHILLLLILLMFTCFVLGTGVPATPAYIIVATLGAPALMKLGIPTLSAHMFVLYYAILSGDNPSRLPVRLRGGIHRGSQRHADGAGGRSVWGSSPTSSPSSSSSSPPCS